MSKSILYNEDARKALEKGMDILCKAVAITLGPKGRNVVIERKYGPPQIINDGVSIAKEIELKDHIENTGVALIRQAAAKTNEVAGDGTSTATVLAHSMVKQGMKNLAAGANPIALRRGIQKASDFIVNQISEYAQPVEDTNSIMQVGCVSAGNDTEVGKLIADALEKVGRDGVISLEEGKSTVTELEIIEGMSFDRGMISPYFSSDMDRMEVTQENAYVLLTDKKITLVQQDLLPVLELVSKTGRPLLIIAEDVEKEALATLVVNKLRGILNVVAIKCPGFGDRRKAFLEDIAVLSGGKVITDDVGASLQTIDLEMLGEIKKVIVTKESTTLISDFFKEDVKARCAQLRRQYESADTAYEKEKIQERLAKLGGGVALIKVGAATETEMKDKKLRLEDAINATKAAVEEGIVPGGGATLVHIAEDLNDWASESLEGDERVGAAIVEKAITFPLQAIVSNAGKNGPVVVSKVQRMDFNFGYNAADDEFVDMFEAGIIDPAKVTRSAVQNAASIAAMVLTTECLIVDKNKEEKVK
jgi:chaperonin GroEL